MIRSQKIEQRCGMIRSRAELEKCGKQKRKFCVKEQGSRRSLRKSMKRGDVSFTFLSRIQEIEWNIRDGRWQSALALALTIPDICGGIAYPELVKRYRDGRVMEDRNGVPVRDVGSQYIRWFDQFAAGYFKQSAKDPEPYLSGQRCWELRCEYLHQNKGFSNEDGREDTYFHLGINCGTSVCMQQQQEREQGGRHIRLDIQQICSRMCMAARAYHEKYRERKEFRLFQTPVLDFVQWADRGEDIGKTVVIVCPDKIYGEGIRVALQKVSGLVLYFKDPEKAKEHLKKKSPAAWVITEQMMEQKNQPWKIDQAPVIVLTEREPKIEDRKYFWIAVPFSVDALRACVQERLA